MALSARDVSVQRDLFRLNIETFCADASGTALLGRNGAGKSTLLLALQGLLKYAGSVERPERCAGVFARPAILHGSVLWNVAIVVRCALHVDERTARERAQHILTDVGLRDALALDAWRLSSGQRQRLALARALALEPQALFLDEPFANIDADGRPALRAIVRAYVERSHCTLVLATQNLADVTALCTRAIVLEAGQAVESLDVAAIETSCQTYLRAIVAEARMR